MEGGFVETGVEVVVAKSLQDEFDVFLVVAWIFGEDEDVI